MNRARNRLANASERTLLSQVQQDLREAGYPLVLEAMRLPSTRQAQRVDVVAFAADSSGALQPTVAVEIKQGKLADPQTVLDQLALARDALGTRRHYVVTAAGWLEADGGLRRFQQVDGPAGPDRLGGELRDVSTAGLLAQQYLWAESDQRRGEGAAPSALRAVRNLIVHFAGPAPVLADQTVPVDPNTRWYAVRDVVRRHLSRDRYLEPLLSEPGLSRPLAQLLGQIVPAHVEDPFAGLGAFLWAVADRALESDTTVYLSGMDVNADVVELASAVGALCPMPLRFHMGDSFAGEDIELVDAVVTQPPLGLRLPGAFKLSSGASTRDGELAAIDVALRRLKPGGRAVLHLGRGWTSRGGDAARYRAYLATAWRVGALIGLPPGVYAGTTVPSTILVVDRAQPSETFVAHLEANWADELAPGGTVLTECLRHLDGTTSLGSNGGRGE